MPKLMMPNHITQCSHISGPRGTHIYIRFAVLQCLFLRSLFLSVFLYVTITPYSLLTSAGVMSPLSYLNLPIFKCWISSCANVVSASPHLAVASLPTHLMSSAFSPSSHPPSLFTSQFDSSASSFPVLLFNKTAH